VGAQVGYSVRLERRTSAATRLAEALDRRQL
jgi:HrpA-like RNA helicase